MRDSARAEIAPLAYASATSTDAMPSWSETAITPEQFFPSIMQSVAAWSGERKLLLAVLQDAIGSFFRYRKDPTTRGRRLFREIHEWFWSTDRQWLCSFESICENLYLDANYIRRGLKQYYDPVAFSAMPPPVQRRRTRRANSYLTVVRHRATPEDTARTASLSQARAAESARNEEKPHPEVVVGGRRSDTV